MTNREKVVEIRGRLTAITRRLNTPSGNPQWKLEIDSRVVYQTKPDAQCAFDVSPEHIGNDVVLAAEAGSGPASVVGYRLSSLQRGPVVK